MAPPHIETKNLRLVPQTRDHVRAWLDKLQPHEKTQLSRAWLALLDGSSPPDPWVHGFVLLHRRTDSSIGRCGFKGPPGKDGAVEIAYVISPEHEGRGYATEAANALVAYAFGHPRVRVVRAHTLPETNASTRVLTKCGFSCVGEVLDPEDGRVWRWEKYPEAA